ncbi:MAG: invasin domain 3-containing protein [Candidatus Shapirobacteria bacterium]|jgi:hypothetical protein
MSTKSLLTIAILLLALIAVTYLVVRPAIYSGRATGLNSTSPITLENSYLFASPLQAKADGKEKIRITVFLLDGRGMGVGNQEVELTKPPAINLTDIQATSDDMGKSVFDLTSSTPGKYEIVAKVNSKEISQKVKVTFTP